ncbi:uncharacterized protein LOC144798133 [Lissotriton helveticus]
MSNNFRMRARLRAVICCCRPVPEGVRLIESVRRMDINILMAFLHTSASANSNENILLCCKILEHRKKLTLLQELAIVHCMYTTITQREVTISNMVVTADTLDSILTDSVSNRFSPTDGDRSFSLGKPQNLQGKAELLLIIQSELWYSR